jgi:hypothetical protein
MTQMQMQIQTNLSMKNPAATTSKSSRSAFAATRTGIPPQHDSLTSTSSSTSVPQQQWHPNNRQMFPTRMPPMKSQNASPRFLGTAAAPGFSLPVPGTRIAGAVAVPPHLQLHLQLHLQRQKTAGIPSASTATSCASSDAARAGARPRPRSSSFGAGTSAISASAGSASSSHSDSASSSSSTTTSTTTTTSNNSGSRRASSVRFLPSPKPGTNMSLLSRYDGHLKPNLYSHEEDLKKDTICYTRTMISSTRNADTDADADTDYSDCSFKAKNTQMILGTGAEDHARSRMTKLLSAAATPETLSGASGLFQMKMNDGGAAGTGTGAAPASSSSKSTNMNLYDAMTSSADCMDTHTTRTHNSTKISTTCTSTSTCSSQRSRPRNSYSRVPLKKRQVSIDLTLLSCLSASTTTTSSSSSMSKQTPLSLTTMEQTTRTVFKTKLAQDPPRLPLRTDDEPSMIKKRPTRLALPTDAQNVNSLHAFVRSSLLEIFVIDAGSDRMSGCNFPGRVGLRCGHCKHLPKEEQDIGAVFYPKNLKGLYRNVCTWQRVHFKACACVTDEDEALYKKLKEGDKSRGRTKYWESSAVELGLVDVLGVHGRGGIMFQ